MKSHAPGRLTSAPRAEVLNISPHAVWIAVGGTEYLLPLSLYPWFRDATVAQISNVLLLHGRHLHWPDLDVDLEVGALADPDRYPLVARAKSAGATSSAPSRAPAVVARAQTTAATSRPRRATR